MTQLGTTFDYSAQHPFFTALTKARPDNSGALWMRIPESVAGIYEAKKEELILKIEGALNNPQNAKGVIKNVFCELLLLLETGFTRDQVKQIIDNYDSFADNFIVPIEKIPGEKDVFLLNQSYGPTDAFKDLALQIVTSMVSIIVEEQNRKEIQYAKELKKEHTATFEEWKKRNKNNGSIKDYYEEYNIKKPKLRFVITQTSTSGDTGPAGGSGIQGKDFVMNVIGFPENEATFSQKGQMMLLKGNVMSIPMDVSFSKIQESMLKGNTSEFQARLKQILENEFADLIKEYGFEIEIDSGSFNSINPGRVDGQTMYHSYGLMQAEARGIIHTGETIDESIPSGNGGHMYSALMARLATGYKGKTIVTCNRNNMFYKIIEEGRFQKPPENSAVDEPSVSMIIEYPNNMIRLFSYAFGPQRAKQISDDFFAGKEVVLSDEEKSIFKEKLRLVAIEVSGKEELETIGKIYEEKGIFICPHTANAYHGLEKYRRATGNTTKTLVSATASPWKFLAAIAAGLQYKEVSDVETLYKEYKIKENTKEGAQELLQIIETKVKSMGKHFDRSIIPHDLKEIYTHGYPQAEVVGPEKFGEKTLIFLETTVVPMFRQQVEKLLGK